MKNKQRFEAQLTRLSLAASVPLLALFLWLMIYAGVSIWLTILATFLGALLVLFTSYQIHQKAEYQFRSLSNLLEAMIHGEYSMRAVSDRTGGAHDDLVVTINGLAERLDRQRWEANESQFLVSTIIDHIDVAIVALDENNQISFFNPAAKKLLQLEQKKPDEKLSQQFAFAQSFSSGQQKVVELSLGRQNGRFNVHVQEFRKSGEQHKLLFISDVTVLLRSEERKAWQSLVRVISHEINNSLSPIASISQTLKRLVERRDATPGESKDLLDGLTLITERSKGLSQFVDSYKQLAKLPEPKKKMVAITPLLEKISLLFEKHPIRLKTNEDVQVAIDPVQFEQVLINLLKNATEAMVRTNPEGVIHIKWQTSDTFFTLLVEDEGSGIQNLDNLFVPFYSTKKQGSGIGLILCRQIIEAHHGRLSINNRTDAQGCCATIEIPYSKQ